MHASQPEPELVHVYLKLFKIMANYQIIVQLLTFEYETENKKINISNDFYNVLKNDTSVSFSHIVENLQFPTFDKYYKIKHSNCTVLHLKHPLAMMPLTSVCKTITHLNFPVHERQKIC